MRIPLILATCLGLGMTMAVAQQPTKALGEHPSSTAFPSEVDIKLGALNRFFK